MFQQSFIDIFSGSYISFLETFAPEDIDGKHGGEGGIRTLDTLTGIPVFETGGFNHSRHLSE